MNLSLNRSLHIALVGLLAVSSAKAGSITEHVFSQPITTGADLSRSITNGFQAGVDYGLRARELRLQEEELGLRRSQQKLQERKEALEKFEKDESRAWWVFDEIQGGCNQMAYNLDQLRRSLDDQGLHTSVREDRNGFTKIRTFDPKVSEHDILFVARAQADCEKNIPHFMRKK